MLFRSAVLVGALSALACAGSGAKEGVDQDSGLGSEDAASGNGGQGGQAGKGGSPSAGGSGGGSTHDARPADTNQTPRLDASVADTRTGDTGSAGGGTGVFVAVGTGGRRIRTVDGVTWTDDQETIPNGGDDVYGLRGVAYGDGKFVAVSYPVWTSVDGHTWTDHGTMNQWLTRALFAQGKWVAAGGYGRRAWSTDGFTWHETGNDNITNAFRAIGYDDVAQRWIAVGDGGIRMSSPDGVQWDRGTGTITVGLGNIAVGQGAAVACSGAMAFVSRDGGRTWAPLQTFATSIASSTYAPIGFLFVGQRHVYISANLVDWRDVAAPFGGGPVECGGDLCVVNDGSHAWRSTDRGLSWQASATFTGSKQGLNSIAYAPDKN